MRCWGTMSRYVATGLYFHCAVLGNTGYQRRGSVSRRAAATLVWAGEGEGYLWREQGFRERPVPHEMQEGWAGWLAAHASFSFQGRLGHLSLLKERRKRG